MDFTFLPHVETFDQMLGFSEPSLSAICDIPMGWGERGTSKEHMQMTSMEPCRGTIGHLLPTMDYQLKAKEQPRALSLYHSFLISRATIFLMHAFT